MNNFIKFVMFWMVADFVGGFLSKDAATVVAVIVGTVMLTLVGSQVLSWILDRKVFPLAGLLLAFPGLMLTTQVFHWKLFRPEEFGWSFWGFAVATLLNFCVIGVGAAIMSFPVLLIQAVRHR